MKRIIFQIIAFLLLIISQLTTAQDVIDYKTAEGSWLGKIPAGGIQLRVIFNLTLSGTDSLAVTLDSPDQGAKDIKIGPVIIDGKNITIKAARLMGEYTGTFSNDTLIKGTWSQAGRSAPLELVRLKKAFTMNRPQEPKPPFPYKSEDITLPNDKAGIELAGTLTLPEGSGPFRAVILITGSGGQNRNEELLGHKPFLVIADYLSRNGIAVLRYDDRGIGMSKGTQLNATSADFATDAEAAFRYLAARKEIDKENIGFAGHSEGGLIAPIVAASNHDVAFIVSLAGPGVKGEEIIHTQNREISLASGLTKKEVEEAVSVNKKIFAVLKKVNDNAKAEEQIIAAYKKILSGKKQSPEETEKALKQLNATMNPLSYNWMSYMITGSLLH